MTFSEEEEGGWDEKGEGRGKGKGRRKQKEESEEGSKNRRKTGRKKI